MATAQTSSYLNLKIKWLPISLEVVIIFLALLPAPHFVESKQIWVPRVGMMRVLRKPPNPYHLKIEPPILLTRKRLLDSKSSEESSENTDDDDSPDTEEDNYPEEELQKQESDVGMYRRKAWRDWDDSNAAEEDYSNDLSPVQTLPELEDFFD